jgi:hypothetical protein
MITNDFLHADTDVNYGSLLTLSNAVSLLQDAQGLAAAHFAAKKAKRLEYHKG